MRAGFLIVILPRKAQVHADSALVLLNANSTKGFLDRFPTDVAGCVRSQHRSVEVIGVQVMVLGLFAGQLMFSNACLPDRVGAPQSLLACCGVKTVGFGEFTLLIGFGHQTLLVVEKPHPAGLIAPSDCFYAASAKEVLAVACYWTCGFSKPALFMKHAHKQS